MLLAANQRTGAALASVMFLMIFLFGLSMSFFAVIKMSSQASVHAQHQQEARALARCGIEMQYSLFKLLEAGTPPYTPPSLGPQGPVEVSPGKFFEITVQSGPPTNAFVARGYLENAGQETASARLALPSTQGTAMERMYDPDAI